MFTATASGGCAALETLPLSDYTSLNVSVKCSATPGQGYFLSTTAADLGAPLVSCNKFRTQTAQRQMGTSEGQGPGQPPSIQVTFSQPGTEASTVSCPEDFQSPASLQYAPQSVAGIATYTALQGAQFTSC